MRISKNCEETLMVYDCLVETLGLWESQLHYNEFSRRATVQGCEAG